MIDEVDRKIEIDINLGYLESQRVIRERFECLNLEEDAPESGEELPPALLAEYPDLEKTLLDSPNCQDHSEVSNIYLRRAIEFYIKFRHSLEKARDEDLSLYNYFDAVNFPNLELRRILRIHLELAQKSLFMYQKINIVSYRRQLIFNILWEFLKNLTFYYYEKERNKFVFEQVKKAYIEFLSNIPNSNE